MIAEYESVWDGGRAESKKCDKVENGLPCAIAAISARHVLNKAVSDSL